MFLSSTAYNPETDIHDLTGKVAIVTGGNAGIGYYTVQGLLRHGAKVYLAARNEERAQDSIKKLHAEGIGKGSVEWLKLDLLYPALAKEAAEEFLRKEARLDILINNAAIAITVGQYSMIEAPVPISNSMATNHLGPFVFTQTLLPLMKQTAAEKDTDVRIVNVSSAVYQMSRSMDWKDPASFNYHKEGRWGTMQEYFISKLANLLWSRELQKRVKQEGANILVLLVHPGNVGTGGATKWKSNIPGAAYIMKYFVTSEAEGAHTSLFTATSPKVRSERELYESSMIWPVGETKPIGGGSVNDAAAADLWKTTEEILAQVL